MRVCFFWRRRAAIEEFDLARGKGRLAGLASVSQTSKSGVVLQP